MVHAILVSLPVGTVVCAPQASQGGSVTQISTSVPAIPVSMEGHAVTLLEDSIATVRLGSLGLSVRKLLLNVVTTLLLTMKTEIVTTSIMEKKNVITTLRKTGTDLAAWLEINWRLTV